MIIRRKKTFEDRGVHPVRTSSTSNGVKLGLLKTRRTVLGRISGLFTRNLEGENLLNELEEILVETDMGVRTAVEVLENLKKNVKNLSSREEIIKSLETEILSNFLCEGRGLNSADMPPTIVLTLGVNGVGKTLTTGKLAYKLKNEGNNVLLAASDTFRAAAIEQLGVLSEKVGVDMIKHSYGADPAAVCFDAAEASAARGADFLLIDTAGRSHIEKNLMERLKKIKRVLDNRFPGALKEVLLVLDATTGQNAVSQAKAFIESLGVTGIVLTKIDGTAKGGIIIAIEKELRIPVKFVGTGENLEDLEVFDPKIFVSSLFEE